MRYGGWGMYGVEERKPWFLRDPTPDGCKICPSKHDPTKIVLCDGPAKAKVLLIGEKPAVTEDATGRPFVGMSGRDLNDGYLPLAGLSRNDVMIANAVRCFSVNAGGNPHHWQARACSSFHLPSLIQKLYNLEAVVLMGGVAFSLLNPPEGQKWDLEAEHSIPRLVDDFYGSGPVWVLPVFHPAAGLHKPNDIRKIRFGFQVLGDLLGGNVNITQDQYPNPRYREWFGDGAHEGPELTSKWGFIAVDTEHIKWITFSTKEGEGWLVRGDRIPLFANWLREKIQQGAYVVFHYQAHDRPFLENLGVFVPEERCVDSMLVAYHHALPRGLKTLARRRHGVTTAEDFMDVVYPASREKTLGLLSAARELAGYQLEWIATAYAVWRELTPPKSRKTKKALEKEELRYAAGVSWAGLDGFSDEEITAIRDALLGVWLSGSAAWWALVVEKDWTGGVDEGADEGTAGDEDADEDADDNADEDADGADDASEVSADWSHGDPDREQKAPLRAITALGRIERILRDCEKTGSSVDPIKRVGSLHYSAKRILEELLGVNPASIRVSLADVPFERALTYACRDPDMTLRVIHGFDADAPRTYDTEAFPAILRLSTLVNGLGSRERPKLVDGPNPYNVHLVDAPLIPMIERMERVGMKIDPSEVLRVDRFLEEDQARIRADVEGVLGRSVMYSSEWKDSELNLKSRDQLERLLFTILELPTEGIKKTKTGDRFKVDTKTLERLRDAHPVVPMLLEYNSTSKLRDAFTWPLLRRMDRDGRIRCRIKYASTETGRLAPEKPNLAQIPTRTEKGRMIRGCFVARPGCKLISVDQSQIEMRVTAHQSADRNMIQVFQDGDDMHWRTAESVYGRPRPKDAKNPQPGELTKAERDVCKNIGFGVLYGITAMGLYDQIIERVKDPDELARWNVPRCDSLMQQWFDFYPGVREFIQKIGRDVYEYGYTWDMFGRIRYTPGIYSQHEYIRDKTLREARNSPIQSAAGGTLKIAAVDAFRWMRELGAMPGVVCEPLMLIHDEILAECSEGMAEDVMQAMCRNMETAVELRVPILSSGKTAHSWKDLK